MKEKKLVPKCYSYIRFSTPEQFKGTSLNRQIKLSEAYADKHGLKLDESLTFHDLGLSAFKGTHRTKGALGRFLALVEQGRIARGSILIVESLDRLSREQVLDALNQFIAIISSGIKIVTLADSMEYTRETVNANIGQLMFSLTIMSRAHEESLMKSKRVRAAWAEKREKILEKKLTSRCPEWLELNKDRTEFRPVKERCEVVRQLFEMKLAGKGADLISRELNQQAPPPKWVPKNGWRKSYIMKILRTAAVIGEYQPHQLVDGKRKPIGEPVKDYFPRVVSDEMYFKVQQQFKRNRTFGGKNGKISNLFGHIVKCGYCGAPMQFVNKGKPPKGGKYLVCDNARRGRGCGYFSVRYDEFEELLLTYCKGLDVRSLVDGDDRKETQLNALKGALEAVRGKANGLAEKIKNLTDSMAETSDKRVRELLDIKLSEDLDTKEALAEEERRLEYQVNIQANAVENVQVRIDSIGKLFQLLKTKDGDGLIEFRLKLRDEIRQLISRIELYPVGNPRITPESIEESLAAVLEAQPRLEGTAEIKRLQQDLRARIDNRDCRTFKIQFHGGSIRMLKPNMPQKIALDVDREKGEVRFWTQGPDGEMRLHEAHA